MRNAELTRKTNETQIEVSVKLDGDGASDYPSDPGCNGPGARSEEFECRDGLDNDGDGAIDYPDDPDCVTPNARWEDPSPSVPAGSLWSRGAILAVLLASGARAGRRSRAEPA